MGNPIHRQNVDIKNADGQNVKWDKRLMEETLSSKKQRKDKMLNGKNYERTKGRK
jgi:hypothetical protein